jgi:hypothetical protein
MALPQSLEQVFNVKSIAPAGLRLDQIKPFQIAYLDEDTQLTVTEPSHCKNKKWRLVWGPPSTGNGGLYPDKSNVKAPIQSLPINYVDNVKGFFNASAERKTFEGYLGWDGISACDNLGPFNCGSSYEMVLKVNGKPFRDTMGAYPYEIIPFRTGCCDDCSGDELVTKTLKSIQDAVINSSNYIKEFVDIYQVRNCCPAETPFTEVAFTDYCVTVCDNGDAGALGDIQNFASYSGLNIFRDSRENGLSTYKVECVSGSPAAYVTTNTVLQNCATCPAGFTAVLERKKYDISIDNAAVGVDAAAWLAEVQAVGAFSTAVSATLRFREGGTSYYEVLFPVAFTTPAVGTVADSTAVYIANVPASCVQTTPTSTAWASCGTKYKISRTMEIVVKNSDCDDAAADLAAITAYMATVPNIVSGSLDQVTAGDCNSRYTIGQYSNCLEDGCDWKGSDLAKFEDLPSYLGASWTPVRCEGWTFDGDGCPVAPTPVDPADCRGGLRFVMRNFDNDIVDCTDDYWQSRETEPTTLEVSISEYGKDGCTQLNIPWKVTQLPTTPQGTGFELYKREVQARQYSQYQYRGANSKDGNLISARLGEVYSIDPKKLYNTIQISHDYTRTRSASDNSNRTREIITLAVEKDKINLLTALKTAINNVTVAQGNCDLL